MGPFCYQKRLQNSIHFKPSSFPNSNILPSVEHLSSGRRGPVATRQRGSGMYKKTEVLGFYFRLFLVPKKNGKLRRIIDLSRLNTFVVSGKSQTGDSNQRLVLFPRSDRCLSLCAHAQSISEIPPILHSGSCIPIQSSSIRTNNKSLCLYSVDDCNSHSFEKEGNNSCFHIWTTG